MPSAGVAAPEHSRADEGVQQSSSPKNGLGKTLKGASGGACGAASLPRGRAARCVSDVTATSLVVPRGRGAWVQRAARPRPDRADGRGDASWSRVTFPSAAQLRRPAVDFAWTPEDDAFRAELRAFLAESLPENWEEIAKDGPGSDAQAAFAREFCPRLAERGWLTQSWPREYGGRDASPWRHAILGEEMWRCGEPRSSQYMNVNWVGPTIMRYGSEEQKALHLPRISAGRVFWCQGFSEPEAGSDLAALRTLAIRDGDVYVVNGTKIWTSYVNHADYCFLVARSDPDSKRHHGISVLLVPMDLPGISVREIPSVVGERYFFEVFFTDARVPVACRLGPEHAGWDVGTYSLAYERVGAARHARAAYTLDELANLAAARGRLDEPRGLQK